MMPRALALALLFASWIAAGAARAEVSLVPAQDGSVGAWLVLGALPEARCAQLDPTKLGPAKGATALGSRFRVSASASGALDLARVLGAGKRAGACAVAAALLVAERQIDAWLLVSADGPIEISVGGRPLWEGPEKRSRAGGWDAIRLRLSPGRHPLILRLRHPGDHWALAARLIDAADLSPPRGLSWSLPGTDAEDGRRLTEQMLRVGLRPGLEANGNTPSLELSFDNGVPRGVALPAKVALRHGTERHAPLALGSVAVGARAVHRLEARLPRLTYTDERPIRVTAAVEVGPARLERSFFASRRAAPLLARANALRERIGREKPSWLRDSEAVTATLAWRAERLRRAGAAGQQRLSRTLGALESLLGMLDAKQDPLLGPGFVTVARWSALDGEPEPVTVQVPTSHGKDPSRRHPLVVVLHGYNGTPSSVLRAFLDLEPASRAAKVDGFVLAPNAHGNAFYRGPGEHEVLAAIDWALRVYPIDPLRVSITGVSMGGTGSAFIALRHADRFSAASPLCGYHSYFVRRDTSKRPIRPWERDRMHHWSPASWAENGRNLPLYVAHGTKDFPLENSRVLIDRYRALGYSLTEEWPDIGHAVWEKSWNGARMWPWLSAKRRDPEPARVSLRTDALSRGRQAWARIVRLTQPGRMATLDVQIIDPTRIEVAAEGVAAFALDRTARLAPGQATTIAIGKTTVTFAPDESVALERTGSTWRKGAREPAAHEKRAGVEGPIREVFDHPLALVWGSVDPRTARANREVAEAFARTRHGPGIHYRVTSDAEIDRDTLASHGLFLVGTAGDHRLLAELGSSLPIRVVNGELRVGARTHSGPGTGAIFVHPSPFARERSLVVVTGVDPAGIWRALSLPQLLPDFLVYDAALAPAAGEQVLGSARVIAGGFFDWGWRLPAEPSDPIEKAQP
jgi:predicted esterase